jgi:hypothetical protein
MERVRESTTKNPSPQYAKVESTVAGKESFS